MTGTIQFNNVPCNKRNPIKLAIRGFFQFSFATLEKIPASQLRNDQYQPNGQYDSSSTTEHKLLN